MQSETRAYTPDYYQANVDSAALASARQIIPFLVGSLAPRSMLELGSGTGIWSKVALDCGLPDVLAVDGPWIAPDMLQVPQNHFLAHHLNTPLQLSRSFDVALCVEVGEHLEGSSADVLVESLTRHAEIVVFGAAMPLQGGTLHINEQWPDYWRQKFSARGYSVVDLIRPSFWNNDEVAYYYKQNTFVYCRAETRSEIIARLRKIAADLYASSADFVFVHPDKYMELSTFENVNVRRMIKNMPRLVTKAVLNRMKRLR